MTIGVGVIGAGVMGAGHATMLATQISGCRLAAVADADESRVAALARKFGDVRTATTAMTVIHDDAVDAVVIASPDDTHASLVLECIRLGKPVLCEKPLATTSDACLEIVDAEMKGGRRLVQVGFMRRFDPGYEALRAAVAGKRLGAPLFFHCIHRNAVATSYTTSEMIILNTAVHEMDIARFVLGEEFVNVTVRASRPTVSAPDRRPQLLLFETVSGALVDVEAFVDAHYGYDVRAELVCEKGALSLAQTFAVQSSAAGAFGHALYPDWMGRFDDAYRRELQAWVQAVAQGSACGASAWDGYVATRTAEISLDAFRTQQRRDIEIGERPAFYG